MSESIFKSAFRGLFVTAFKTFGVFVGLLPFFLILGGVVSFEDNRPEKQFFEEVMPGIDGKRQFLSNEKPTILQIDIHGVIGLEKLTKERVQQMLVESREGDLEGGLVKAVFLNINSPGGTVFDSDGIYRALLDYKQRYDVPVYAFVDGLSASGAVYLSSAADKIYATDVSVVGSVGVILNSFLNFADPLEKIGVKTLTISAGKDKDAMNPLRPWTKGESQNYQYLTDTMYDMFIDIVTKGRPKISREKLIQDYGAKVFPAANAMEKGYIDGVVTTREEALQLLAEDLELDPQEIQVVRLEKESFLQQLLSMKTSLFEGKVNHRLEVSGMLPPELDGQLLYLYRP